MLKWQPTPPDTPAGMRDGLRLTFIDPRYWRLTMSFDLTCEADTIPSLVTAHARAHAAAVEETLENSEAAKKHLDVSAKLAEAKRQLAAARALASQLDSQRNDLLLDGNTEGLDEVEREISRTKDRAFLLEGRITTLQLTADQAARAYEIARGNIRAATLTKAHDDLTARRAAILKEIAEKVGPLMTELVGLSEWRTLLDKQALGAA